MDPRQKILKRQNGKSNQDSLIYGKIPPQAAEVEGAILGAILLEKDAYSRVSEIISEQFFYLDSHKIIFCAIQNLATRQTPIDTLTVMEELKGDKLDKIGGVHYLTGLTNSVVSSANIESHCRIVLQKFIKRKIIEISGELINESYEDLGDAFELLENAESQLLKIRNLTEKKNYISLVNALVDQFKHMEQLRKRKDHLTGITSGHHDLDLVTCGWQNTDLIILAARPSVGKTALGLSLARNAAKICPVGFFSIEMSYRQLVTRLLASESDFPMWYIKNGKLDDEQMKHIYKTGLQPLSKDQIFLDDTPSIKLLELKAKARRMVSKDGVRLIIIDYLQLIIAGQRFDRKDLEVGFISSQIKALAKELDIPIILLSQLNRDVEKSGDGEPKLIHLRDGGAIEQDADLVIFLWRPTDGEIQEDSELQDMINVKIEKHRNGSLERFLGKFKGETQKWEYLKVVDKKTLSPLGGNWRPVKDYTEPDRESLT